MNLKIVSDRRKYMVVDYRAFQIYRIRRMFHFVGRFFTVFFGGLIGSKRVIGRPLEYKSVSKFCIFFSGMCVGELEVLDEETVKVAIDCDFRPVFAHRHG